MAPQEAEDTAAAPSIPFDYLSVVDELHSGRIKVSGEAAAAEYREAGADLSAEFAALLDQVKVALAEEAPASAEDRLPPVDPDSIAAELGLDRDVADMDFNRLRRGFAFDNHPDRVAPLLRQRAAIRMQIANMLIDDARRRAESAKGR